MPRSSKCRCQSLRLERPGRCRHLSLWRVVGTLFSRGFKAQLRRFIQKLVAQRREMRRRKRIRAFTRQSMAPLREFEKVPGLVHVFLLAMRPALAPLLRPDATTRLSHSYRSLACDRRHDFGQTSSHRVANRWAPGRPTGDPY